MDLRPNHTIYIQNMNEKIKKEDLKDKLRKMDMKLVRKATIDALE